MIREILTASGVPFRETRWPKPPAGTYAVYMDDVEADGPDGLNRIYRHLPTVELYESTPDPEAEDAIEAQFDIYGLHYTKQARYWWQDVQRYQVVYETEYTEKI